MQIARLRLFTEGGRIQNHSRNLAVVGVKEVFKVGEVVIPKLLYIRFQRNGNATVIATCIPTVRPAAIAVVQDDLALGVGAGNTCRRIVRLGAALEETHHFGSRHGSDEAIRHLYFERRQQPIDDAFAQLLGNGGINFGVGIAENDWAESVYVVYVLVAVYIPDARAIGARRVDGVGAICIATRTLATCLGTTPQLPLQRERRAPRTQ